VNCNGPRWVCLWSRRHSRHQVEVGAGRGRNWSEVNAAMLLELKHGTQSECSTIPAGSVHFAAVAGVFTEKAVLTRVQVTHGQVNLTLPSNLKNGGKNWYDSWCRYCEVSCRYLMTDLFLLSGWWKGIWYPADWPNPGFLQNPSRLLGERNLMGRPGISSQGLKYILQ